LFLMELDKWYTTTKLVSVSDETYGRWAVEDGGFMVKASD